MEELKTLLALYYIYISQTGKTDILACAEHIKLLPGSNRSHHGGIPTFTGNTVKCLFLHLTVKYITAELFITIEGTCK